MSRKRLSRTGLSENLKEKLLLNEFEVSARWDIPVPTLRGWRVRRLGPRYVRLGGGARGSIRYRPADVEAYLDQHTIDVNQPSPRQDELRRRRGRKVAA